MEITEVKIRKIFEESTLRAIVSVTFDDCFTVHDIKIVFANSAYILVMPNKKLSSGRMSDIAHPINSEFRGRLEKAVLDEYEKHIRNNDF